MSEDNKKPGLVFTICGVMVIVLVYALCYAISQLLFELSAKYQVPMAPLWNVVTSTGAAIFIFLLLTYTLIKALGG